MAVFDLKQALREAKALSKGMKRAEVYSPDGHALRYRLFAPETEPGKKYPLVVFLHGAGERGTDNKKQVEAQYGAQMWAREEVQKEHPCFIAAPQCPTDCRWTDDAVHTLVVEMIYGLLRDFPTDASRVYLTGLSMGGMGTWFLTAAHPELFAAAAPICGAAKLETARGIKSMPVWAFHAEEDPVVPAAGPLKRDKSYLGTRLIVTEALRHGATDIRYTEYPASYITEKYGHGHVSWVEAYDDKEFIEWMFAQRKDTRCTVECVRPGVYCVDDGMNGSFYIVEGASSALVIDTGMSRGDINACVEKITRLPYSLALTHGHGDHSMHSGRFDKVYLDFADKDMLYSSRFAGQGSPDENKLVDISGGHDFDLGGGVVIKTVPLRGHTPGSLLFVDAFHKCVFSGDAVGSGVGVWMQVPGALKLSEYAENIAKAMDELKNAGVVSDSWVFLGGHDNQQYEGGKYNPVTLHLMSDMKTLCEKLVSGEIKGALYEKNMMGRFGTVYRAEYDTASMLYHTEQLA